MINSVSEYLKLHNSILTWYPDSKVCVIKKDSDCRSIMRMDQFIDMVEEFFSTVIIEPGDGELLDYLKEKSKIFGKLYGLQVIDNDVPMPEIVRAAREAMEDDR